MKMRADNSQNRETQQKRSKFQRHIFHRSDVGLIARNARKPLRSRVCVGMPFKSPMTTRHLARLARSTSGRCLARPRAILLPRMPTMQQPRGMAWLGLQPGSRSRRRRSARAREARHPLEQGFARQAKTARRASIRPPTSGHLHDPSAIDDEAVRDIHRGRACREERPQRRAVRDANSGR